MAMGLVDAPWPGGEGWPGRAALGTNEDAREVQRAMATTMAKASSSGLGGWGGGQDRTALTTDDRRAQKRNRDAAGMTRSRWGERKKGRMSAIGGHEGEMEGARQSPCGVDDSLYRAVGNAGMGNCRGAGALRGKERERERGRLMGEKPRRENDSTACGNAMHGAQTR